MFDVSLHIEKLNRNFSTPFEHVTNDLNVPEHWKDYCAASVAQRLSGATQELSKIGTYFPNAARGLRFVVNDGFLARNEDLGLCRFLVRQLRGESYLTYSRIPRAFSGVKSQEKWELFQLRAPEALVWVYNNVMDGLSDIYDFAGFKSTARLSCMSEEPELWEEFDWFRDFSQQRNPHDIIELLSSGGGAYLMLDLNRDLREVFEPKALFFDTNNSSEAPEEVDLFPYLDEWMSIGLAEVDLD